MEPSTQIQVITRRFEVTSDNRTLLPALFDIGLALAWQQLHRFGGNLRPGETDLGINVGDGPAARQPSINLIFLLACFRWREVPVQARANDNFCERSTGIISELLDGGLNDRLSGCWSQSLSWHHSLTQLRRHMTSVHNARTPKPTHMRLISQKWTGFAARRIRSMKKASPLIMLGTAQ